MSATELVATARALRDEVEALSFGPPVTATYDPLVYAWEPHERYLRRFGDGPGRVVLVGMNPGPWGMSQTGVPFGEIAAVRDWMGITGRVERPANEHPKRVIEGFACTRTEVSGQRLWGWAARRHGSADAFFARFFVLNYCPLVFMEGPTARNLVPEKLPAAEREPLFAACDRALARSIDALRPSLAVGVGGFAEDCLRRVVGDRVRVGRILHPSPASPAANRGWADAVERELAALGVT